MILKKLPSQRIHSTPSPKLTLLLTFATISYPQNIFSISGKVESAMKRQPSKRAPYAHHNLFRSVRPCTVYCTNIFALQTFAGPMYCSSPLSYWLTIGLRLTMLKCNSSLMDIWKYCMYDISMYSALPTVTISVHTVTSAESVLQCTCEIPHHRH